MHPVPGYKVSTAYGIRGQHWRACGWHTGVDIAAPKGTPIVAARPGVVRYTSYGSAFGPNQFAVVASDGSEDFYAHTLDRPVQGTRVQAGDRIARIGALGNATGPHLHFERHKRAGSWNCSNMTNPQPSLNWEVAMSFDYHYSGKPSGVLRVGKDYKRLDVSNWDPPKSGLEHVLVYLNCGKFVFNGNQPGRIRIRLNRLDGDYSGYQDFVVVAGIEEMLITHTYFEKGDGTTTAVDIKCLDGLIGMEIGTRYLKRAVVN